MFRLRSIRTASALLALISLMACSPAIQYQRPDFPVAAAWPDQSQVSNNGAAKLAEWKVFFSDPRLQALIAATLEYNRDLRIALARADEARAMYGIARADRFPGLTLSAGESAAGTPSGVFSAGRSYNATITAVSYEIDFWGRVASLSEAARSSFLASEEARKALRSSLIAQVADIYFSLLDLDERISYVRSMVASRQQGLDLVRQISEVGAASRLDYLMAENSLGAVRSELAGLERQRANATNALTVLVGKLPTELPAGRALAEQDIDANLSVGLPAEVLLARPDVLAAEQRLVAAHANIDAARAAFFPRLVLTAALGVASPALAGLFSAGSGAWSYQPTLTLPLFDAGRTEANVDLNIARKNVAVADYEKTVQLAFREVADLLAARATLAVQRKSAEGTMTIMQERAKIAQSRYQIGMGGYLEVLDAQREALAAQQTVVQIQHAQLSAAAQLYKALGGG